MILNFFVDSAKSIKYNLSTDYGTRVVIAYKHDPATGIYGEKARKIMTVKEAKESKLSKEANEIDVFRKNNYGYTSSVPFHTDFFTEVEEYDPEEEIDSMELMDKEDYSNSVLANSSISFGDMFNDTDKILCILLSDHAEKI